MFRLHRRHIGKMEKKMGTRGIIGVKKGGSIGTGLEFNILEV